MSNEIKDFRRKQGDLEFFFLCLVRADNRDEFDYLLRYGRTLQLGGEKYARVDEIDLESDIADNADKLDVVMLQVRDNLKSPARIDVFKLPNIKRMLDNGIVSSREVAVLLGVCDSLVSIMTDNKELFKSLVKKYTKQDDSGSGRNEPQQYPKELLKMFKNDVSLIEELKNKDRTTVVTKIIKWGIEGKCANLEHGNKKLFAELLIKNGIVAARGSDVNKDIDSFRKKF